ncbi:MAG: PAS domain S-box protein [bacterium]|jgi:PAS domain S-box-containing protein
MEDTGIETPSIPSDKIRPYKILLAASLIVPLLLFAIIMWQDYRMEFHAAELEVLRTTEIFQQHALNVFETHQLVAERANDRLRGMSWEEIERSGTIHAFLGKICTDYPQVQAIWVADSSGVVRNASQPLPASPIRIDDRDYFQALRETDVGVYVGRTVSGRVMKGLMFNVARRREGKTGVFDGVVVITVLPEYFSNFWNKVARHSGFSASLIRSDGIHLARAPFLNPGVLSTSPSSSFVQAIRRGEKGAYVGVSSTDGKKRLYAVRKVGEYNVYMVYGVDMKVILQAWEKDLVFYGCIFGTATAALFLLSLVAMKRTREEQDAVRHWRDLATRLEKSGEELRITTQRLQLATSSGRLGVWDLDVTRNIMTWDDRVFELFGVSRDAFSGGIEAWKNSLHPDDRETAVAEFQAALRGEKEYDTDYRVVRPDGSVIHVKANGIVIRDADGNAVRMIGINKNITRRKRTEEELEEYRLGLEALVEQRAEALLAANRQLQQVSAYNRRLIETSLDPLVTLDASGKITDVNRAMEKVTGYPRDHLIGKGFFDYLTDPERGWTGFERVLREGTVHDFALDILHRDGTVTSVLYNASVILDDSGEVLGVFAAARDITERQRAEEQVRHAQKLESLGVLAGGIAHDFNNLLMAIMGYTDLALSELPPVSPVRGHLEEVEKASHRAADLCRQMLAYSGKGRFVIESLDLGEVVKEMADMLAMSISKKAILEYRISPDLPRVEADASQIRQVVMNLIINASEAIGDNPGVISVTVGTMDCDCAYLRETGGGDELPEGRYVFLEVADTGSGMGRETQKKIFDPFFTTKFTGRGLGLAAVLGIVRGHRGAIKVYSEAGKGSTFKVLLPAAGKAAMPVVDLQSPEERWKGTGTVLLVDDDAMVRRVGVGMLESLGFHVVTAADGREAVEIFRSRMDEIRCVVLDLKMPRMDGEEAFREIRRLHPGARVVLSSGYNEQYAMKRFAGEGLSGFLQKPYNIEILAATLRKVIEG